MLHEWFTDTASAVPELPALVVHDRSLSYRQLDVLSHELANRLRGIGTGHPPRRVGLLAARSVPAYAGYLAILRTGAAVVPLSPDSPIARNLTIARSAAVDALLLDGSGSGDLVRELDVPALRVTDPDVAAILSTVAPRPTASAPAAAPALGAVSALGAASARGAGVVSDGAVGGPDDIAYILFTSGSTGRPKGVPVRHRNVDPFVRYNLARYRPGPGCRFSQTFDLAFDPSVFDMFVCWGSGATLVVPSRDELFEPADFVNRHGITHWYSVPSLISMAQTLAALPPDCMPGLRWSLFAGERLTLRQAAAWADAAPNSVLENVYGPTELTVTVAACRLPRDRDAWPRTSNGTVPIGTIYPHLEAEVRDAEGRPGGEGMLCVRGSQRFDGYLDPTENAGRFVRFTDGRAGRVSDPVADDDWYDTGDRVRVEGDLMVHLGRDDDQVKVQGRRVELSEIEATLREQPAVHEAVVLATETADAQVFLAAVHTGDPVSPGVLRRYLRDRLAPHMVPARFVHVDSLPVNANGKIDRATIRSRYLAAEPYGDGRGGRMVSPW
ncbi:AMP-binding protein [Plantactinospora endophytica]|uniref:Amino acid adenylation protein n=1 Tax=Plantactinospora endophytica TaxID=673535 RepID=A0ABQ4DV28_9ACTN|nr:AMP-binding protein [Plantactinospora endophytica]GIG86284.1 amino acid adenylation protein [Plantactinospora endophytica]